MLYTGHTFTLDLTIEAPFVIGGSRSHRYGLDVVQIRSGDDAGEGGFAGTVLADDGDAVAALDGEIEVVQDVAVAVGLRDRCDLEQRASPRMPYTYVTHRRLTGRDGSKSPVMGGRAMPRFDRLCNPLRIPACDQDLHGPRLSRIVVTDNI